MKRMARLGACAALIVTAGVARGASGAGDEPLSTGSEAEAAEASLPPAPAPARQDPADEASKGAGAAGMEPQGANADARERGHAAWVESIWNSP